MIFGEQSPKIIDDADNDIYLNYSVILKDEPEYRNVVHESDIDGDRNIFHKGYHWNYEIMYHLYKDSNPRTKYETLIALLGEEVTLYRHRDKDPVQDSTGTVVPFVLMEVTPIFITQTFQYDGLILRFKSTKFIDLTQSLDATLITEYTEEAIPTEDGEGILIG